MNVTKEKDLKIASTLLIRKYEEHYFPDLEAMQLVFSNDNEKTAYKITIDKVEYKGKNGISDQV